MTDTTEMKLTSESKFFLIVAVVTVAIIGIAAVVLTQPEKPAAPVARETLITPDTHTRGNASASAYLVEFSDFQCPACGTFAPVVERLTEQYKDSLFFAYRHFPLPAHEYAIAAARAAEAAAKQGKFWEASRYLFDNQNNFSEEFFATQFAQSIQLDQSQYNSDINDAEIKSIVAQDLSAARALNLPGTPAFFLNGVLLKNLVVPEDLVKAVESAL